MFNRWHEATDENKVNELVESMKENGWQGSPLVSWGEQLYTGAHRSTAAEIVEIEYPTIDLETVFAEAGVDFEEAHFIAGEPTSDDARMVEVLNQLPYRIKSKYGIDNE